MTPTEVIVTKKKRILKSRERRPGSGADAAAAVAVVAVVAVMPARRRLQTGQNRQTRRYIGGGSQEGQMKESNNC